jgi:hypothetical protein
MNISRSFAIAALAIPLAAISAQADDSIMPGPYASWTDAQKSEAAQRLKNGSNEACSTYLQRAAAGGMRATYESAACIEAYFVLHLPADYPDLDAMKASAQKNYELAKSLGSDIPAILEHQ